MPDDEFSRMKGISNSKSSTTLESPVEVDISDSEHDSRVRDSVQVRARYINFSNSLSCMLDQCYSSGRKAVRDPTPDPRGLSSDSLRSA